MRELVYYVAASVDGFIAAPDGSADAFPTRPETLAALFETYPETCPAHVRDALGVTGAPRRFDTVVMGANTYQPAVDAGLASAYPHLREYVVTHRELPADTPVTRIDGDVVTAVRELKAQPGMDVWLCGGAELAGQLVDLIDEIQVKVNPVVLGSGIPLVRTAYSPRPLRCVASRLLPGGVVLSTYRRD